MIRPEHASCFTSTIGLVIYFSVVIVAGLVATYRASQRD